MSRKGYPSDVSDEEWAFVASYLTLMSEDAPPRDHSLREVFNGLRWIVRTGAPWRWMPNDLPPWDAVYQQSQRRIKAGVFEAIVNDRREELRIAAGKAAKPSAAIFDSRTLQSTPESGARARYDGAKRKKVSKTHIAVDTLGNLLALLVTPADEQDRAQVGRLAERVQSVTGESVKLAFADKVAVLGGSWTFILNFATVLAVWVILNSYVLKLGAGTAFDPFSYILLNLFISMLAAVQDPIIMMSQNRQAPKDHLPAPHDYEVNLKAELEICRLHEKVDELRGKKWLEQLEIQERQRRILEQLLEDKIVTPVAQ